LLLPNAERAIVEIEKMRDYLLSPSHPVGRFKAAFFRSVGYGQEDCERFRADLLLLARIGSAVEGRASSYGRKFEVRGTLRSPRGTDVPVTSVWIVLSGSDVPSLVTVFPAP
jgi:hypothetical protein